jgi:mannose-1-phosphate guanylyltransferase
MKPPSAMILCAGFGTRLRPLTDELPKPLVPIGDGPLLGHVASRLRRQGIAQLVANAHHMHDEFIRILKQLNMDIRVVSEPTIRGTAGGVAGARDLLGAGPCVVHNGDILADVPVPEVLRGAEHFGMCLAVAPRPAGEGTVGLDREGAVVRLRGEIFGVEASGGDYIGVAGLDAAVLASLPDRGCLIGDVALPRCRTGLRVGAAFVDAPWSDVGTIEAYHAENIAWLARCPPGRSAWTGAGVEVDPAVELASSLVGAGARVSGLGRLERCVVWPGAHARAPLADAVVTTRGQVVRLDGTSRA